MRKKKEKEDRPPSSNETSTPGATRAYGWQGDQKALAQAEAQVVSDWKVGDVILETYEVISLLGEGGFGKVYRVHHRGWNTDLAVKSPRAEILTQGGGVDNFVRECETWVNLGLHPHIVSCFYVRKLGGIPRVFAEFVDGGSLKEWIDSRQLYEGSPEMALERMLDIAIQMAWGLGYAHEQGVVHQDVKPANVMLTLDGTAKLTDFGLARARGMSGGAAVPAGQSILVSVGGMTPGYCSPEQAARQPLTRKTDIWSWGVSVLEMFAGDVTWLAGHAAGEALAGYLVDGTQDNSIPSMPAPLGELLRYCFQLQPDNRPANMTMTVDQLKEIYAQETGQAYARSAPQAATLQGDSLNNKALSLYDMGRIEEAKALWQANLQANPGHLETTYNLGLVQWRSAQKDDVGLLRDLRNAAVTSDDWRRDWLVAQVHLERGDVMQARAILDALPAEVSINPEVISTRLLIGKLEKSGPHMLRMFEGHTSTVTSACMSKDCHYVLSGSEDKTLKLWDVATGKCLRTFEGHMDGVNSVSLSGDGRNALSGSKDKTLKLWDVASGMCLQTFIGHNYEVKSVSLSKNGQFALSGSWGYYNNTLILWDTATGQSLQSFQGHKEFVDSVCLSGDGHYALSDSGNQIKLWDVAMGTCLRIFEGHTEIVSSISLSADGYYALSGSEDNTLKFWDVGTGKCLQTFEGHMDGVNSVFLSGDARYALSGSQDQTLKFWDAATGRCLWTFEEEWHMVTFVALSDDGRYALSVSMDETPKLWDMAIGYKCIVPFSVSHFVTTEMAASVEDLLADARAARQNGDIAGEVRALRGARKIPGYQRNPKVREGWSRFYGKVRKTSFNTGWLLRSFEGHTNNVNSVCLSADGCIALSGSDDNNLKMWDVSTGYCLRTFEGHKGSVKSVALTEDGSYALSGSYDDSLKLWNLSTGKCLQTLIGHKGGVSSVCLSGDGRYALSGGAQENTIKYWDMASGKCLRIFEGYMGGVTTLCLSRDGNIALSGSREKIPIILEVATGKCLGEFNNVLALATTLDLSDDCKFALLGSPSHITVWNLDRGRCIRVFSTINPMSACLSGDGRFVLLGTLHNTLELWEVASGKCLRIFEGHTGAVFSVCLSNDGRYALSGSWDKSIKLWELDWELEDIKPTDWEKDIPF